MLFEMPVRLYTEYVALGTAEKLHAGGLLAQAGRQLLETGDAPLDNNAILQKRYLLRKIAGDLLRQSDHMGHFKQYDCVPALTEYTCLALDLAFEYCERKADRRLLPFLARVIYYETQHGDSARLRSLQQLYDQSLELEKQHHGRLVASSCLDFPGDIWGF